MATGGLVFLSIVVSTLVASGLAGLAGLWAGMVRALLDVREPQVLGFPESAWAAAAERNGMSAVAPREIEGRIRDLSTAAAWGPGGVAVEVIGIPVDLVAGAGLLRALCQSADSAPPRRPTPLIDALRQALRDGKPDRFEANDGRLLIVVAQRPTPWLLSLVVRSAVWVAEVLQERDDLLIEVRTAALTHDSPRVRASMLEALSELSTVDGERVANVFLDDPDPLPRLVAARLLADGLTLSAIALDRDAGESLRRVAFEALALQPPWLADAIGRLAPDDGRGALAAVAAAEAAPTSEVCSALASRCPGLARRSSHRHRRAARAVARLAARARSPALADATLAFLGLDDVAPQAVAALGVAGTPEALAHLRAFGSSLSSLSPLRSAVANTIAAIRSRAGSTGALALADPAGGALSLALGDGALSLPGPQHPPP